MRPTIINLFAIIHGLPEIGFNPPVRTFLRHPVYPMINQYKNNYLLTGNKVQLYFTENNLIYLIVRIIVPELIEVK